MPQQQSKQIPVSSPEVPLATEPLNSNGKGRRALWLGLASWLLLAAIVATVLINRQSISDWWRLRDYHPSAAIQQLVSQDTMTDYARHMFYLNQPQLVSSVDSFRKGCPDNSDTVVLGCYHPPQAGIYIYNVKDDDLRGIAQVTAAHETLHAAYERLSKPERQRVDGMLQDYYKHGLTDEHVKSEIKLYQKTEPNDVLDEMHSTFGTEVVDLPPALEAYYKQYFTNRATIVAYEKQYEQAFSARQQVVRADDTRLAALRGQIETAQTQLDNLQSQLKAAKSRLDSLRASGQNDTYNAEIDSYNTQVNTYNSDLAALRGYITEYNALVATRNSVADQLNVLNAAVDTRLPQPATP